MAYEFEAPTYVDFGDTLQDDEAEVSRYFDVDHEISLVEPGTQEADSNDNNSALRAMALLPKDDGDILNNSSRKTSPKWRKTPGKPTPVKAKKTPAKFATPLKAKALRNSKTPGSLKKLSQTPSAIVNAISELKLTPVKVSSLSQSPAKPKPSPLSAAKTSASKSQATNQLRDSTNLMVSPLVRKEIDPSQHGLMSSSKKRKLPVDQPSIVDGIEIHLPPEKVHIMETRQDKAIKDPPIELRSRSIRRTWSTRKEFDGHKENSFPAATSSNTDHPSDSLDRLVHSNNAARKASPFVSMAEAMHRFQSRTPLRFRMKPKPTSAQKRSLWAVKATIPQSPALRVKQRSRPVTALSHEEIVAKELEEIRKKKIKALPVPGDLFNEPKVPRKSEIKPPTKPEPFKITELKKKEPSPAPEPFHFTARPLPKHILEGVVGVGQKRVRSLTEPKSPGFHSSSLKQTQDRVMKRTPYKKLVVQTLEIENGIQVVRNKEIGHSGVPLKVQDPKKRTEVKPFSFEERNKSWAQRKQEKIKELKEQLEKTTVFHAKPVPQFRNTPNKSRNPSPVPKRPLVITTTKVLPQTVTSAPPEIKPALMPQFKARAPVVLHKKPFEPVRPNRLLPVPDLTLNSDKRAKEREAYDQEQLKREKDLEALRQQIKARKEKEEQEEIARLRKNIIHKPLPMPLKKKPFEPKQNDKALTDAVTPLCLKRSKRLSASK